MELISLFDIYKKAVFEKDVDAYMSVFDDHIRVFDMWERWSFDALADWRTMTKDWFSSLSNESVVVTFSDILVEANDAIGTASAFVRFAAVSEQNVELRSMQNRLTWVALKKGNSWKIIHQHTSSPIDSGTMKAILQR